VYFKYKVLDLVKRFIKNISFKISIFFGYIVSKINMFIFKDVKCSKDSKRCFYNIKSPNYKYEYFGKNTPICCATHLYNILKDTIFFLNKNGITYFIAFGTLLGAIRHKGLIPWDTDVDIVVSDGEIEYIYKLIYEKFNSLYDISKLENLEIGRMFRINLSKKNTLHVDIFSYIYNEDKIIIYSNDYIFKKSEVFPLKKVQYYDLELLAPNDIKAHLNNCYYGKDYMEYGYKQWASDKSKFIIDSFLPAEVYKIDKK